MKNIYKIVVFSVFVFCAFSLGFVEKSEATVNPSMTIGSISAPIGSHVSVPVTGGNFNNGVAGMDILIKYDPAVLRINSITPSQNLEGALFNKNYSANMIYISYLANVGENFNFNNGTVAVLNFTVLSGVAQNTNIMFKTTPPGIRSQLFDEYGTVKITSFVNGSVEITPFQAPVLTGISISHPANKIYYITDDLLDISGLEIIGHYSDNSTNVLPIDESNISGFDSSVPAVNQVLTVNFDGMQTTYTVHIEASVIFTPTLTIDSMNNITSGSEFSVDVSATDFKHIVAGMDLIVEYDPSLLRIDSISRNPGISGISINKNYASNMIYIGYLADMNTGLILDNNVLATLNFTAISNPNTEATTNILFKTNAPGLVSGLCDFYGSGIYADFIGGSVSLISSDQEESSQNVSLGKKEITNIDTGENNTQAEEINSIEEVNSFKEINSVEEVYSLGEMNFIEGIFFPKEKTKITQNDASEILSVDFTTIADLPDQLPQKKNLAGNSIFEEVLGQ